MANSIYGDGGEYGKLIFGQLDESLKYLDSMTLKISTEVSMGATNIEKNAEEVTYNSTSSLSSESRFVLKAESLQFQSLSEMTAEETVKQRNIAFSQQAQSTLTVIHHIRERNIQADILATARISQTDEIDRSFILMSRADLKTTSELLSESRFLDIFEEGSIISAETSITVDSDSFVIEHFVNVSANLIARSELNADPSEIRHLSLELFQIHSDAELKVKKLSGKWTIASSSIGSVGSIIADFSLEGLDEAVNIISNGSTITQSGDFSKYINVFDNQLSNKATLNSPDVGVSYNLPNSALKGSTVFSAKSSVLHDVISKNRYSGKSSFSAVQISKLGTTVYPIVYDKFETEYEGFGLCVLNNIMDFKITKKLNGPQALTLSMPKADSKWQYIDAENFIRVKDDLFIIKSTEEIRDDKGTLLSNIQAEHIQAELLDEYIERLFPEDYSMQEVMKQERDEDGNIILVGTGEFKEVADIPDRTLQQYLDRLLAGTRFKASARTVGGTSRAVIKDCNPVEAIQGLIDEFDCEYTCTGLPDDNGYFWLTFVDRVGAISGQQFRYRKNLTSIKRTTDTRNVVTVLHAYGKDGLKATITSPNVTMYRRPKHGKVELRSISDLMNLYKYGQKYLELVDKPSVTYEATVLDLTAITDTIEADKVSIGDTVRVIDEELGIELDTRIFEYEEYPLEPQNTRIVFNNPIPSTEDLLEQVSKLFDHEGNLKEDVLLPLEEQFNLDDLFGDFGFEDGKFMLKDEFDELLFELSADEMKWFEDGEAKFEIGKDGLGLGNFKLSEDGMTIVDEFDYPIARFGKDGIGTTELTLGDLNDPSNQAKISLEGGEVIIRHSSYESYISIGRDIKIFAENKVYIDGGGGGV